MNNERYQNVQATDPDELIYYHEPFQKNKNYPGFLIVKK